MTRRLTVVTLIAVTLAFAGAWEVAAHRASSGSGLSFAARADNICATMQVRLAWASHSPDRTTADILVPGRANLAKIGRTMAANDLPVLQNGTAQLDALNAPAGDQKAWRSFLYVFHFWLNAYQQQVQAMKSGNPATFHEAMIHGIDPQLVDKVANAAHVPHCGLL